MVAQHILQVGVVARIEHLVGGSQVELRKHPEVHPPDRLDPLGDIGLLLRVRLVGHSLVPFPGGPGFVRINPRDEQEPVFHLLLQLCQPAHILADRLFVMGRTGADHKQKPVACPLENSLDLPVPLRLNLLQCCGEGYRFPNLFCGRNFMDIVKTHRLYFSLTARQRGFPN